MSSRRSGAHRAIFWPIARMRAPDMSGCGVPPGRRCRRWSRAARRDTPVATRRARGSGLELRVQLLLHRNALDLHVFRQSILVRRMVLALDERLQVFTALLDDAESILGDEIALQ